jgi:GxxExxY protein
MRALNDLTARIVGCAIAVHRGMGPGLLESVYQACMLIELAEYGLSFEAQRSVPAIYRGRVIDCVYRADIIVEKRVVLELKSVARHQVLDEELHHAAGVDGGVPAIRSDHARRSSCRGAAVRR